jgi:hypothetical protein
MTAPTTIAATAKNSLIRGRRPDMTMPEQGLPLIRASKPRLISTLPRPINASEPTGYDDGEACDGPEEPYRRKL